MSLASNLINLTTRVATEFRTLRAMLTGSSTGDLSGLATTNKTSVVAAINEAVTKGGASSLDALSDVTISGAPGAGEVLRHNGTAFVNVAGLTYYEAAGAAAAAQAAAIAASQPVDPDLSAIAALSTTAWGRALLTLADSAALAGLIPAASTTVQGKVSLATTAEATAGVDTTKAVTSAGVAAALNALVSGAPGLLNTLDELAQALGDDPNFATTMTTALANKQPLDADLTAIAALVSAADKVPYATGSGTWALATQTPFARTLIDDPDAATARGTLSVPSTTEVGDVNTDFVAAFNTALTA
jgi:hypothetical protein